jgi:ABC-2 type transport system permease protein
MPSCAEVEPMSWRRVWALVIKEFIQIRRDRRTLAIALVMPLMLVILLGYAINTVIDHIPSVVVDESRDEESRALVQALASTTYFSVVAYVDDDASARSAIDRREAKIALVIPPDYGSNIRAGRAGSALLLIDGSDPNTAQTALFAADATARIKGAELLQDQLRRSGGRDVVQLVDLRPTVLYNPSMRSADFMVPAVIGVILQLLGLILTAFAIVRERERGTLEQLVVTPITPWELMAGKMTPYVLIAFFDVAVVLCVGLLWFQVEFAGSLALLLLLSLLFLLAVLGMGLFISTISQTQTQAMQTAMFLMMPSFILSGFFFPLESMPELIRYVGYLMPLTYFLQILRAVVLKGSQIGDLWGSVLPLAFFALVWFTGSAVRFRRSFG